MLILHHLVLNAQPLPPATHCDHVELPGEIVKIRGGFTHGHDKYMKVRQQSSLDHNSLKCLKLKISLKLCV